jgi:hypothetical protein
MLNEEKIKVMIRKEKVKLLLSRVKEIYTIGDDLGHPNILEKAKWKEESIGAELGHTVFSKSTGDVKGADALDENGKAWEYKTQELNTFKDVLRFFESVVDGTNTFAGSMTYNNGYSRENVNSYKDIGHIHGVFFRGDMLAITEVSTDYVTSDNGLMKRVIKEENGKKYKSTNGNGVGVHYENGGVRNGEGKVVFIDDIRK